MSNLILKIFVEENGKCPTRGKNGDAGLDVYAALTDSISAWNENGELALRVHQGHQVKIPLGFRYAFWKIYDFSDALPGFVPQAYPSTDYWLEIKNRSGVGTKSGMVELAAVCDASYRGIPHYCAAKITSGAYIITHGMKIAQALIHPFVDPHKVDIIVVNSIEELGTTERGDSGFGGSGT